MKIVLAACALAATLIVTSASAQGVNLTGRWQCVALCFGPPGGMAYITQYGWDLNVLAGVPSRAWIDYPGHIWFQMGTRALSIHPTGSRCSLIVERSGSALRSSLRYLRPCKAAASLSQFSAL